MVSIKKIHNKLSQHLKTDVMTRNERVIFIIGVGFGLFLTFLLASWWFLPLHIPNNFPGYWHIFDFLLFIILSYIVWHPIIMELFLWYNASYIRHPKPIQAPAEGLRVAYLTAFVPSSEPFDMLERNLAAMIEVEYPHDTWLLDEGNDPRAKEICHRLGVKHYSRHGKEEFNTEKGRFAKKTKGGNYNSWLHHYVDDYDIIMQHDVDFLPSKDLFTRTLGYFNDPEVAFVGLPQVYGNIKESWIARGAAQQTYSFYGTLQKGFFGNEMTLLIGANHMIRTNVFKIIDGYTAHITEDMLTGMKLYAHKDNWKSVYVPEILLVGEGPTTWESYFKQQQRWAYGCMDIVFNHAPSLLPRMGLRRMLNYSVLQQFYFSGIAQVLGILLIFMYFVFGITSANMTIAPIFFLYVPLLLYQLFFQLWIQRFNVDPANETGLYMCARILSIAVWPIYFLAFISVLLRKNLRYAVTPKGSDSIQTQAPVLFIPHFILGSITFFGLVIAILFTHHLALPIIFWAIINSIIMYGLFFAEAIPQKYYAWNNAAATFKKKISDSLPASEDSPTA
jgi:cellulose synthase (UDP-forming)